MLTVSQSVWTTPWKKSLGSGRDLRSPSASSYVWDVHYKLRIHCSARLPMSMPLCCAVDMCVVQTEQWWCKACHVWTRVTSDEPRHRDGSSDHRMGPTPQDRACCSDSLQWAATDNTYKSVYRVTEINHNEISVPFSCIYQSVLSEQNELNWMQFNSVQLILVTLFFKLSA